MAFGDKRKTGAVPKHLTQRPSKAFSNNVHAIRADGEFGVISKAGVLKVRFYNGLNDAVEEIDLSDWITFGDIGLGIADYLADWGRGQAHTTRISFLRSLTKFRTFLCSQDLGNTSSRMSMEYFPSDILLRFGNWLNDSREIECGSSKPLKSLVKSLYYNKIKNIFVYWGQSERYKAILASPVITSKNLWPGAHHQIKSTDILDPISCSVIRAAALNEIVADRAVREATLNVLNDKTIQLPDPRLRSVVPYKELDIKLHLLVNFFDANYLNIDPKVYPGLSRSLRQPYGTIHEVMDCLHFSIRKIVPYIVLLGFETLFNAEGLLGLTWSQIGEHPIFGEDRLQIAAVKNRSKLGDTAAGPNRHVRSFSTRPTALNSVPNLLKLLERFTRLTRNLVEPPDVNKVFVFYTDERNENRSSKYKSFSIAKNSTTSVSNSWRNALRSFIEDNDLPDFTLRTLRASGGDLVHKATGDTRMQQLALGHANLDVTVKHYRGAAAKKRDEEFLSTAMAWRERYILTNGKSDTRNGVTKGEAHSAATPGFRCADPFNSPLIHQQSGKLCTAFGSCAACPLAYVDSDDPRAYARLLQFENRLNEARIALDPARYLEIWADQLNSLQVYWLPKFTEAVRNQQPMALPPFPELE